MTPNKKFADHVTSLAFNLTLSKAMVVALVEIANNTGIMQIGNTLRVLGAPDTTVPTRRRLAERGLIHLPTGEWPYVLTEAGEHVVALLKIAGIAETVETIMEEAS